MFMRAPFITVTFIILACGIIVGFVLSGSLRTSSTSEATLLPAQSATTPIQQGTILQQPEVPKTLEHPTNLIADLPSFSDIAEQTVKAVTNISSRQVVRQRLLHL